MSIRHPTPESMGAIGVAVVAMCMLLWAIFGSPPYAYFGVLKWVVGVACLFEASAAWNLNRVLAPIGLVLLTVGAIHVFGKMRREEWVFFNWAAVAGLAVAALLILYFPRGPDVDAA